MEITRIRTSTRKGPSMAVVVTQTVTTEGVAEAVMEDMEAGVNIVVEGTAGRTLSRLRIYRPRYPLINMHMVRPRSRRNSAGLTLGLAGRL